MSTEGFQKIIAASVADRADLFLTTANRLGAPLMVFKGGHLSQKPTV